MLNQKPTKTITEAYTTTDADNGYRIICNSATPFTVTLHTATGRNNFDMEIVNIGAGAVTCGGLSIAQNSHAHVGNNGGTAWVVAIGGGAESDPVFVASDAYGITSTDTTNWDTAYSHSQAAHAPSDAQKNSDITKAEIEAKLTGTISTHAHSGSAGDATSLNSIAVPEPVAGDDGKYLMYDHDTTTYVLDTGPGNPDLSGLATKTERENGDLVNSLQIAKGLFSVQAQMAAGNNNLINMAINAFNDNSGVDATASTYEQYDETNKLWQDFTPRTAKTVTANGGAKVSTAEYKVGSSSAYFNGTSDSLSFADLGLDTDSFTIEMWFKTNSSVQYAQLIGNETSSAGFTLLINNNSSTGGQIALYRAGGLVLSSSSGDWSDDNWHHVALTRNGTAVTLWIDGSSYGTATNSASFSGTTMYIGRNNQHSPRNMVGYIDELRVSKGVARYTSSFTPSTSAFTPDTYTVLLLHCEGADASTTFTDDVGTAGNITLITDALTCSSAPSKGYLTADEELGSGGSFAYHLSRDDGTTWTSATKDTLADISAQPSGTSLRLKAVSSGANTNKLKAIAWGWQ